MEKKIHDEKMERFKEHAKKVKEAAEKNKEVVETAPPSAPKSQIDNGRNNKESPPVKISISPTRKTSLQKSPFEVKKTKFWMTPINFEWKKCVTIVLSKYLCMGREINALFK